MVKNASDVCVIGKKYVPLQPFLSNRNMTQENERLTIPNASLLERMGAIHYENDVMIFDRHALHHFTNRIFQLPYALIALVDRGETEVLVEDRPYHIATGDHLLLLLGQAVKVVSMSDDFHARFVLMSSDFIRYITTEDSYYFIQMVRNTPVVHLRPHTINAFCACYDLVRATIQQTDNPYRKQMLHHIVKTYVYGVVGYMQPEMQLCQSREEEITYLFMELVDQHYREHHNLAFYADHMRLSAKYISKCVHQTTGMNALHCIAMRLMKQAKAMLLNRQNTIGQIGYELGFCDPSAFGKFFRAHEHIGPRQWRDQQH